MRGKILQQSALFLLGLGILTAISCKKEEDTKPPVISFKNGQEYTTDGDTAEVGGELLFGIQARGDDANITNFTVKKMLTDGTVITMMDTGTNTGFLDVTRVFHQSVEEEVEWTFAVQDRNRRNAEISLTVYKDPDSQFGGIHYYPSVKMGYQENTEFGHFLNPFTGKVFFEDSAGLFQQNMHFLVYYIVDEDLPSPVFSSPGEMDNFSTEAQAFYPSIAGWDTRPYTLWDISVDDDPIPESAFDQAFNDSLLIVSYDDVWGKKKFKWATDGRVIPFKTGNGKLGLVKVIEAGHAENGTIEFAIKIQQ